MRVSSVMHTGLGANPQYDLFTLIYTECFDISS